MKIKKMFLFLIFAGAATTSIGVSKNCGRGDQTCDHVYAYTCKCGYHKEETTFKTINTTTINGGIALSDFRGPLERAFIDYQKRRGESISKWENAGWWPQVIMKSHLDGGGWEGNCTSCANRTILDIACNELCLTYKRSKGAYKRHSVRSVVFLNDDGKTQNTY